MLARLSTLGYIFFSSFACKEHNPGSILGLWSEVFVLPVKSAGCQEQ